MAFNTSSKLVDAGANLTISGADSSVTTNTSLTANAAAAGATITIFTGKPSAGQQITLISTDNTSKTYTAVSGNANAASNQFSIDNNFDDVANSLETAIEHASGHNGKILVSRTSNVLSLTQSTTGTAGNTTITSNLGNVDVDAKFVGGSNGGLIAAEVVINTNTLVVNTSNASGKVGIGTTTPGSQPDEKNDLVIGDHTGNRGMTIASVNTGVGTIRFAPNTSANDIEGWIDYSGNTKNMRFGTNGLNTRMTIDNSGNVGIGETTPLGQLHVKTADSGITTIDGKADELVVEGSGNAGISILGGSIHVVGLYFPDSSDPDEAYVKYDHGSRGMAIRTAGTDALTIDSSQNVTIAGSLTVNGTVTSLQTTNTLIKDKLIELGNGTSGTPSGDSGLIIERGSSNNAAFVWDESIDSFVAATTTATGASTGDLSLTDANLKAAAITASGRIISDDTTEATSTTDGSIQTDGGLSVAKSAVIGDDLDLLSDSAILSIGADKDATLTHDGTTGLTIAASPISIDSTGALDLNSTTGDINFQDGGTNQLSLDLDGTAGEIIMKLMVDSDDFVFKQYDGTEVFRVEDNGDFDVAGGLGSSGVTISASGAISADGRIITDDATDATSTTDGSLQTDGGLSVVKDAVIGDDLKLLSDSAILSFGASSDVAISHVANTGLLLNSTNVIQFNDASQNIGAPNATTLDINATDEIELNATLIDVNGNLDVSGTYTGGGLMTTGGNIVIPDAGSIGSASDTNAITISSGGVVAVTATTANTSASDGALTVAGGAGIAADLTVGDDLRLISDSAVLSFGADSDTTLTHTDGTGLTLNSTNKLCFNDASQFIQGASATVMEIGATDEIGLTATLVDMDANLDLDGTANISGLLTIQTGIVPDAQDGAYLGTSSLQWSDLFLADGAVISFGDDNEITLTHVADDGLILKHVGTGDGKEPSFSFHAGDNDIAADDVLGSIFFKAPDEGAGTDAILVAAGIEAVSEGDFSSSNNATKLSFKTGASEAATEKVTISSEGNLNLVASNTELRFYEGSNYVGFEAPALSGDQIWVLPAADGSNGQQLTTDGSGNLSWAAAGSGGGSATAADDIGNGDAAVNILTTSGNITLDAQANDADIIFKVDDDGSAVTALTLDGSDEGNAVFVNDLKLSSDAAVIHFGANNEVTLTHVHDVGLTITNTVNGTDDRPVVLQLKSEEDAVVADDVIGSLEFAAGDSDGTDGATVAAGIHAIAEGTFSASANATKLVFTTGVSETAAASATAKMTLSSAGLLTIADDLMIKDGGTIGVASTNDAMTISSGGIVTFKDDIIIKDGGTIGSASDVDAISIASDGKVTFTQDIILKDGVNIGSASDTNAIGISSGGVVSITATTASTAANDGALTVAGGVGIAADLSVGDDIRLTTDSAVISLGAGNDATLTHDGTTGLTIAANPITLDSVAALNLDAGNGIISLKDSGTEVLRFTEGNSGDITVESKVSDKDMIFKVNDGGSATEVFRLDGDVSALVVASGKELRFVDANEKIVSDGTDLTIASGAKINLNATSDIHIPNDVGIVFGGASEKIEGDGTDLTISANNLTIDCAADLILDAGGNDFKFKAGGTEILNITNSSSDVIIKPIVDAKDIIFQQRDGTEVARIEDNATFNVVTGKLAINGTAITSTAAEINLIDGGTSRGTTAVADGDGFLHNDAGTMRMTNVSKLADLFAGTGIDASSSVLSVAAAQTGITSILATDVKIGEDDQTKIDFEDADKINFYANNAKEMVLVENALTPGTSDGTALGTSSLMWSDIFLASGAVANFNNGDMTLTHSSNTLTVAGGTLATAALTASTITASGIVKTDDATDATSTTDGSLQTDGGLSVVKDAVIGNDLHLLSDSSVVHFGTNSEITLTHEHNVGLILTHTATADNTPVRLTLKSEEDAIIDGEIIGIIDFKGGDSDGTDAVTVCAGIEAVATDTHAADNNAAKLSFKTAASEAATEKMALASDGSLSLVTDGKGLKFGADGEVTLTHVHNTGLLLSDDSGIGTTQLQFGDSGTFIQQSADGVLNLQSDGSIQLSTDTVLFTSANTTDPQVTIKNTTNDDSGPMLVLEKDRGSNNGADNDVAGQIQFIATDDASQQVTFGVISVLVKDASNGAEGGEMALEVASHNGTPTVGLRIVDGDASGEVDVTLGAGTQSVTNTSGKFGVYDTAPKTAINVINDYHTVTFGNQLADGEGGGRVLRYSPGADDTLTVGQLYFLHTDGTWDQTDADAVATGATQLLGIGLGNARSAGCLMEGFIRIPSTEILNVPGSGAVDGLPVYVSTTAGHLDFTQPSGTGDFVRIVGHAIDDTGGDVLIYFNPSNNHVEL